MADLGTILAQLELQRGLYELANSPTIQFGTPTRPLVGASILPERQQPSNEYAEQAIKYRTIIANDGTRYSAPQMRPTGIISGTFRVSLGHQDVATQFTSKDYDDFLRFYNRGGTMDAIATFTNWGDNGLVQPHIILQEKQRWDALINAVVVRKGDNQYQETVTYPNPAGHRSNAGGQWSSDAYDPYDDIVGKVDMLTDKGYSANRFICSRKVLSILLRNVNIAQRSGSVRVLGNGTSIVGRASAADLNATLNADGMPPIETFDTTYNDLTGTQRYMPDNVFCIFATTGVDETIALPNGEPLVIENTLGYSAVGVAAGYDTPGRQIYIEAKRDKPPRIDGQSWQASLPVILEPEAMAIITGIS